MLLARNNCILIGFFSLFLIIIILKRKSSTGAESFKISLILFWGYWFLTLVGLCGGGGGGVVDDVEQNRALAFGAPGILPRQHDIHEAAGASHQHHRCRFRARRVPEVLILLVHLQRHARASRRHCRRTSRGVVVAASSRPRRRQVQLELKLRSVPSAHRRPPFGVCDPSSFLPFNAKLPNQEKTLHTNMSMKWLIELLYIDLPEGGGKSSEWRRLYGGCGHPLLQ